MVINSVDTGNLNLEGEIISIQSEKTMKSVTANLTSSRHDGPKIFSADLKFCSPVSKDYLQGHGIDLHKTPPRLLNENGIVKQNNDVFKKWSMSK